MAEKPAPPAVARVLSDLRHGGHALSEDLFKNDRQAPVLAGSSLVDDVIGGSAPADITTISTPFGYMFVNLRDNYPGAHLPKDAPSGVVASLKALGSAMVDRAGPAVQNANATIPPVYTYLGQFIDHDMTANTDRDNDISITGTTTEPLPPDVVVTSLHNLRLPALNLDSLYGNGPHAPNMAEEVPYVGIRFEIGPLTPVPVGAVVPGDDLPRFAAEPGRPGKARIGDGRNDENLIVAQLHLAFLRFHNAVVDWVYANDPQAGDDATFARARQLVEWHYQFIAVEDFLRTIAQPAVVDSVLAAGSGALFAPADDQVFMPLEYSVAAYRFGHSMVRGGYDHNENFGEPNGNPDNLAPFASFDQLFQFTGNGDMRGAPTLPSNWPIRWERFTDPASPFPTRFARKIDTNLAPPLFDMLNEGRDPTLPRRVQRIVQRLAVRNLLRGYRLAIPTGQDVARELGVPTLSNAQLLGPQAAPGQGHDVLRDALIDGGFVDETPLWFYVLKEAEVQQQGNRLGDVGSRIVAETIIGQVRSDPTSYLRREGGAWTPAEGVRLPGGGEVRTIRDLLIFAGVHPPV